MKITNIQYGRCSGLPVPPQALAMLPTEIPVPPGMNTSDIEEIIWQQTGFRAYSYKLVPDDEQSKNPAEN